MSTLPENELDLDKLFLPAWAQEPASAKHYARYEGDDSKDRGGEGRDRRPPRRGPSDNRPPGNRPGGERRGPRREGDARFPRRDAGPRRDQPREHREPPAPPPEVNILFTPDEHGVESLSRQIKTTGRAYPLFDIARLILQKPERYSVTFKVKKNAEGKVVQPLFVCALDETLWLSEDEAVAHVLKNHFGTFYQTERTATEPPKGKYTFVAQCGMSGAILGPPNYHDYQNQLHKLHTERFSRMPFEAFKARVKIVKDEEVVKKWIDDQSWKTDFICLNMPEPLRLPNREAVEKHFREVHKESIIKPAESQTLPATTARSLRSQGLARLVRQVEEDQRRFPLQIATVLSQQFASNGLQFFKVNRTITHVSIARPHYLDLETTPVSDGVRRTVEYINSHPRCTRRKLVQALAPSAPKAPAAPAPIEVKPDAPAAAAEGVPATPAPAPVAPAPDEPSPEQTALSADLHWLIHQGHVIEFANGTLETAKKPLPRPPKPEPKQPAAAPEPAGSIPGAEPIEPAQSPLAQDGSETAIAPDAEIPIAPDPEVEKAADVSETAPVIEPPPGSPPIQSQP